MIFGTIATREAVGAVLAHTLSLPGMTLKKGRMLSDADVRTLLAAGIVEVTAARPVADDVAEDEAAAAVAAAIAGEGVTVARAATGRANLHAAVHGLAVIDAARIERINAVDEAVTVATLAAYAVAAPRGIVATVKIIPFAVPRAVLDACLECAGEGGAPALRIAPLQARQLGLVQTVLPSLKPSVLAATLETTRARVASLGSRLEHSVEVAHEVTAVARAIVRQREAGCAPILVLGASAIADRRDVIPAAIESLGGEVVHFGMPVDPGNLLLLGRLGDVPIIGLPGCARSPKLNGADWVLQRLLADLPLGRTEIMRMGVGGLLAEIPTRPLPRLAAERVAASPAPPRIAAVVLAAGQGTRMGEADKLLAPVAGRPLVEGALDAAVQSQARPVLVVVGHRPERLRPLLADRDVQVVVNAGYEAGLASSLRAAISALPADIDGAVILLGDMPKVRAHHVDRLIETFAAVPDAICVSRHRDTRGNPVLWPAALFAELAAVEGDAGGRVLFRRHAERIVEVAMDEAVLIDVDRPEDLRRLAGPPVSPAGDEVR